MLEIHILSSGIPVNLVTREQYEFEYSALYRFVGGHAKTSQGSSTQSTDIIRKKAGDCTEHAALFTALARAAGMPARKVYGLMYLGDDVKAFGGHVWNEVLIDKHWMPVDAIWGEVEADATHIRVTSGFKI